MISNAIVYSVFNSDVSVILFFIKEIYSKFNYSLCDVSFSFFCKVYCSIVYKNKLLFLPIDRVESNSFIWPYGLCVFHFGFTSCAPYR